MPQVIPCADIRQVAPHVWASDIVVTDHIYWNRGYGLHLVTDKGWVIGIPPAVPVCGARVVKDNGPVPDMFIQV